MIDVAASAGDQPVVERNHSVPDFPSDERGKPAFPVTSLSPGRRGVASGHFFSHDSGVVSVSTADVFDSLAFPPFAFGRSGCPRGAGSRFRALGCAGEAGRLFRRAIPERFGTSRQQDAAARALGWVPQPKAARLPVVDAIAHGYSIAPDPRSRGVSAQSRARSLSTSVVGCDDT